MIYIEKNKQVSEILRYIKKNDLFLLFNSDGDFEDSSLRLQILNLQNVNFVNKFRLINSNFRLFEIVIMT
jgi:hypothetical protein